MNRLQQLREAAALSRADLARRSDVTQAVIEQLESGAQVEEAERAVLVPGEPTVESQAVILNKLADALGATLIAQGVAVTPEELLEAAKDDLPTSAGANVTNAREAVAGPDLPLNGVSYPAEEAVVGASSHSETETPDDIDAALSQMVLNSQITASEAAAETGIDEVRPETGPDGPVSPAADVSPDSEGETDFVETPLGGQQPTGGTETINMAELPDTLPIAVLPDSPTPVKTEEISPLTNLPEEAGEESPEEDFASQETQEIHIPPELLAQLPSYGSSSEGHGETGSEAAQQFELPSDIQSLPGEAEQIDVPGAAPGSGQDASDMPTMQFDVSELREQMLTRHFEEDSQPVADTTTLEQGENGLVDAPGGDLDRYSAQAASSTADEPSAVVMAEDAAATNPISPAEFEEVEELVEPIKEAGPEKSPAIAEIVGTLEPEIEPTDEPAPALHDAPTIALNLTKRDRPDSYEAVPLPDMPGPAPAPATMEADSEAHPEPPDMAEVAKEDEVFEDAAPVSVPAVSAVSDAEEKDLGIRTAHDVDAVVPNLSAPPVPEVAPTHFEVEQATPAQDDGPLTVVEAGKEPAMKPYIAVPVYTPPEEAAVSTPLARPGLNGSARAEPQIAATTPYTPAGTPLPPVPPVSPEAKAEDSRYRLPASTVIPSVIGVVAALGWYAWRSWRRSKAEAERVAPYYKKK